MAVKNEEFEEKCCDLLVWVRLGQVILKLNNLRNFYSNDNIFLKLFIVSFTFCNLIVKYIKLYIYIWYSYLLPKFEYSQHF